MVCTPLIDEAERLLRDLPSSGLRDDALDMVEPARGGDVDARRDLANILYHERWLLEREREKRKQRKLAGLVAKAKQRKLDSLVAKAKKLGVDVTVEPNGAATFRTGSGSAPDDKPQTDLAEWIAKQHAH
jgi:hypothetical protein